MTATLSARPFTVFHREARSLLWLGAPIMVSQLAQTAMGFVDTVMAGRYNALSLAAVAIGSSLWLPLLLALLGVMMAATPLIAHAYGAGEPDRIRSTWQQSAWLALLLGGTFALLLYFSDWVFPLLQADPALTATASAYVKAVAFGLPAIALFQALRSLNEGLHRTWPAMVAGLLALLANIPLNYLLIYGKFGLPEMGAEGCGWATAMVMWLEALVLFAFTRYHRGFASLRLWQWQGPRWAGQKTLLRLGIPMGMAVFVEVSMFTLVALFLAKLGTTVVGGHQVVISFTSMTFMVPLSLSMAITIRAGSALGAGQARRARAICYTGLVLTLIWAVIASSVMLLLPERVAAVYSHDQAVVTLAAQLLFLAGLFQFSDALQVSAAGSLRAYKNTLVPFLVVLVAYWLIGLPLGYLLGLTELLGPALGAAGFWIGLIVGLSVAAVWLNAWLWWVSRRALTVPVV